MVSAPTATNKRAAASHCCRARFGGGQDAGRLAGGADARDAVGNDRLHLGVARVAQVAHRGGQVGRADEHTVHPRRGGDGVEVVQGLRGFGLHQQADLVVGLVDVVRVRRQREARASALPMPRMPAGA